MRLDIECTVLHLERLRIKLRTSVTGLNPYSTRGFFGRQNRDLYSCHPLSVQVVFVDAKPADVQVITDVVSNPRMD